MNRLGIVLILAGLALADCGGGGGGGGGTSTPAVVTPAPSVQGDMLGISPSRGWNYQVTGTSQVLTTSLYADPSEVNNVQALVASSVLGNVPTVLTSAANMDANLVGAMGVTSSNSSYTVVSEISAGSTAAVPGSPLLVPNSLTLGQTWTSTTGAVAVVTDVGTMPNANACPTPVSGAQVRYTYPGFDETVSYVPGCGITDMKNDVTGAEFVLVSVGTYSFIGQLDVARRAESATYFDTVKSLLGLEHTSAPSAHLIGRSFRTNF